MNLRSKAKSHEVGFTVCRTITMVIPGEAGDLLFASAPQINVRGKS